MRTTFVFHVVGFPLPAQIARGFLFSIAPPLAITVAQKEGEEWERFEDRCASEATRRIWGYARHALN